MRVLEKVKNKKGFTLVEVIVVLVILAILIAISVPALTGYISNAKDKAALADAGNYLRAAQSIASEMSGQGISSSAIEAQIEDTSSGKHKATNSIEYDTTVNYLVGEVLLGSGAASVGSTTTVDDNGKVTKFVLKTQGKEVTYSSDGAFSVE